VDQKNGLEVKPRSAGKRAGFKDQEPPSMVTAPKASGPPQIKKGGTKRRRQSDWQRADPPLINPESQNKEDSGDSR